MLFKCINCFMMFVWLKRMYDKVRKKKLWKTKNFLPELCTYSTNILSKNPAFANTVIFSQKMLIS